MRRTLKLLLLLGIGLALTGRKPDSPSGTPGSFDKVEIPAKYQGLQGNSTQKNHDDIDDKFKEGEPPSSDDPGATPSNSENPNAGPPVDPADHLPESDSIIDHVNERWDEGATDHYVKDVPRDQLVQYVDNILNGNIAGIETRYLERGRVAYWDPNTGALVIEDPGTDHGGTVFTPTEGHSYFEDLD